jgi:hypothetical protein
MKTAETLTSFMAWKERLYARDKESDSQRGKPLKIQMILILLSFSIPFLIYGGLWYLGTSVFLFVMGMNTMLIKRNNAVYKLRSQILDKFGLEAYRQLPDYDTMYNHFWIPVKKYRQEILLKAGVMSC